MSVDDLEANNYDEIFMQQSVIFAGSLQDLKNLRKQLYSAAEYFEDSYTNGGEKQLVIDTLKDYAVKAFVNTVDHLGSVTTKVNELVDSKAVDVSESKIMVSCIEQRLRTRQGYSDKQGVSQQTRVIQTPKYHKRYILPDGQSAYGPYCTVSSHRDHRLSDERDHLRPLQAPSYTPPDVARGQQPKVFAPSKTLPRNRPDSEKQSISAQLYPLLRSGSLYSRASTPNPARPSISKPSADKKRFPSEPRKSVSMNLRCKNVVNLSGKDLEHQPSKSKKLFKSLLSRRKSKKDDSLDTFLDAY